ncbi:hypothetical protein [Aquimarina mytili]|uniref:Uncharacterized protein n=1 Tax=Aquimarina mytili TaxID=874423 RepID=A0A937A386_9FLAO|nr:hypothetical protein [Aquimarina mytili]MBL0686056.1 hypothetical protein [Aquimarina mytili]
MKNTYHYIGWAGTLKYFSSLSKTIEEAKKEGTGFVSIYKNGVFLKTIETTYTAH